MRERVEAVYAVVSNRGLENFGTIASFSDFNIKLVVKLFEEILIINMINL